jgi:hypothetical protein
MTEDASSPDLNTQNLHMTMMQQNLFLYDSSWVNLLGRISITSSFHMFPRILKSLHRNKAVFYSYLMQNQDNLKPGKYHSTSSMVLSLLVRLYNFFGNGTHSFMSG